SPLHRHPSHLATFPLNPVPSQLLRSPSSSILCSLTHIFNLSLSNGVFSSPLKHAQITPILKKPSQWPLLRTHPNQWPLLRTHPNQWQLLRTDPNQ
ncbi:unnamed protein product, partial [Staurois parvus]